jgi:hypothetical protein
VKKALILLFAVVFLSACGSEPEEAAAPEVASVESPSTTQRTIRQRSESADPTPEYNVDLERQVPRLTGQFEEPGMGLSILVDGSSPQAFAESLELIAAETSPDQYRQLDSALRYLRMYSSAAWGGLPGLYESLDNMSGEEIIQHAARLRGQRGG